MIAQIVPLWSAYSQTGAMVFGGSHSLRSLSPGTSISIARISISQNTSLTLAKTVYNFDSWCYDDLYAVMAIEARCIFYLGEYKMIFIKLCRETMLVLILVLYRIRLNKVILFRNVFLLMFFENLYVDWLKLF